MKAVLLLVAAGVAVSAFSPFAQIPVTKSQSAPEGCCLPSTQFQFTLIETRASWDVHGDAAGYSWSNMQVDQEHNLAYVSMQRATPTPKFSAIQQWVTPGAVAGTWFEFFKFQGVADCYVKNVTRKPDVFYPLCFRAPYIYRGDAALGTHAVSLWEEVGSGVNFNETHFVQMDACVLTVQLGMGVNGAGDWEERQSTFVGWSNQVTDPSKFLPPSQCQPLPPSLESVAMPLSARLNSIF